MNYYIGGTNASGKSTILRQVARKAPEIDVIHGTSLLMKAVGLAVGDYHALRQIPL